MDINGKVALVTGGASGLGRATAQTVLEAGGQVALVDLNADLATQTVRELGDGAAAFAANVAQADSVKAAIDAAVERFGAIHINVNCAGIGAAGRTLGRDGPLSLEAFNFVIQVNLVGTFNKFAALRPAHGQERTRHARRRTRRDSQHRVRGGLRRADRPSGVQREQGRRRRHDSAHRAGSRPQRHPRLHDCAGHLRDADDDGRAGPRARPLVESVQFPNRLGEAPEFAQLARQIIENPYLNGETIRLDGGIRMQPR